MTFLSHPVVKDHLEELAKITAARGQIRAQLEDTWTQARKTNNDVERRLLTKAAQDLEQQINSLTSKGQLYMLKIDQLNGVR